MLNVVIEKVSFDTKVLPESYLVLRNPNLLSFDDYIHHLKNPCMNYFKKYFRELSLLNCALIFNFRTFSFF